MPLAQPVFDLFGNEFDRFQDGLALLDQNSRAAALARYKRQRANPDGSTTINIPGWSDILHTSTPYRPTSDEFREYYKAKRQKRAPDLPQYVQTEIARRQAQNQRIASSAQPDYAQGFGSILTALDNVQDFLSTVATFSRLGLWGLQKTVQAVLPGATTEIAAAAARAAAAQASRTAAAEFAATLAARAEAGNLIARLALNNPAIRAAARDEAIRFAASTAAKLAFRNAMLGVAGRMAARFIPIVGWIVLASDVLNLLSLLGMMATPTYALLCQGPQEALAAGVPAAVFKRALKSETWQMHNLNPFSRQARAARVLRSAGKLPSVGNLLEVLQTTDQLWGVGISLGGLVGVVNEAMFGLSQYADGKTVSVNGPPQIPRTAPTALDRSAYADPVLARMVQQAGTIATTAPAVMRVQDDFDEATHLQVGLAYMQATALLARVWQHIDGEELADELIDRPIHAPLAVDAGTAIWAEAEGFDLEQGRRWWFDGAPRTTTGARYIEAHATAIPDAIKRFIAPRRNAPTGAMYGAIVNQGNDYTWSLLTRDPHFFKFQLTTDARLVSSFTESGYVIAPQQDETRVWKFWNAARAELERSGRSALAPELWVKLAHQADVGIIRLLPPDSPVPTAWDVSTATT